MTPVSSLKSSMESPWAISSSELLNQLSVNAEVGLSGNEVKRRLLQYGPNSIIVKNKKSRWSLLLRQLKSPVVYVLIAATIIAFSLHEYLDGWAILGIVILNVLIGYIQEAKAEASIEALTAISSPKGKVLREGKILLVNSESIYPGDILIFEAGDYIVADARIINARQLAADESILTGESLPVEKQVEVIPRITALADRKNMLHASTAISNGTGKAVVIATGRHSEIGKIAGLMESSEIESTPLQIRLEQVSRRLLFIGIIVIGLVIAIGLFQGREMIDVLMSALSLSIAAIPEGLPTVVTVALVMAVRRMSKKKALIRKLDSVETLGATDIICTDKTGTLTTGKMQVRELFSDNKESHEALLHTMIFCNNASLEGDGAGDTTEIALLEFAQVQGVNIQLMHQNFPRLFEWSFDSKRKRMSVAVATDGGSMIHVKGAPEMVLTQCDLSTDQLLEINSQVTKYSQKGMRVLAFANKRSEQHDFHQLSFEEAEQNLHFLGLVAMADPPRADTIQAIRKCQASGIRIIMITGDHPLTAVSIAHELGIIKANDQQVLTGVDMDALNEEELKVKSNNISIYARVSPENKLKLVNALKNKGHIVAMTGDGVNDAPALKAASIGVAMGKGGTEVARQASSLVLTDDNFATIVDAVEEGRAVNGNIKRTLQYLLSTNLAELLFILGAILIGWPIPLQPINLLWVNLVTDGLPSLALAAEKVPKDYLLENSSPSSDTFFDRAFYLEMIFVGLVITVMSIAVYSYGLTHFDPATARSFSFSFLVYVVLFRSFSCRSETKTFFEMKPNLYHFFSILIPLGFQFLLQESDMLLDIFNVKAIPLATNFILMLIATVPVTIIELFKIWRRR